MSTHTHTDTYPTTPSAAVATVPHRRRRTTLVALGMATLLGIGVGVGAAALVDHGSSSVVRPPAATATANGTTDADFLWNYLAALPIAERDHVLVALVPDPTSAFGAIAAGEVAAAH